MTARRRSTVASSGSDATSKMLSRAATIVALAVGVLLAPQAQPAQAGTYDIWNCSVPGQAASLLNPWLATEWLVPNASMVDACATGGGWSVHLSGNRHVARGWGAGLTLSKPTGSRSQIDFVRLTVWYAARLDGSGQPMYFVWNNYRSDGHHLTPVAVPPDSENAVAEFDLHPDTLHVQLAFRCSLSDVVSVADPCVASHHVPLLIRGMKVTLSETTPPTALRVGGGLLDPGSQSGTRTVTYATSDAESGVRRIDVLLGDTLVASNDLSPRCSDADFTACPVSDDGVLQVDTRAVANGPHRLTLRVLDAAGNAELIHHDSAVEVFNAQPATSSIDSATFKLDAQFKSTSRSTLTVPYGRSVSIRGRLTRASQPVAAGSQIEVLERRDRRGATEVSRARVKTKADGSFSARLATTRPSRTIRLAYRPTAGGQVSSRALKLRVRTGSQLRASLRGRILRFSGRVLSAPIPKAGKRVVMEGRSPGSAWTAFKRLRTDRKGRFSGTYRLRVRRPGVRLQVRAAVPTETGYGYLGSRSRTVTLRVR